TRGQLPKTGAPPFDLKWEVKADAVTLRLAGLPADAKSEFFPIPPDKKTKPGHPRPEETAADGSRTIVLPISEGGEADAPWRGVLALTQADGSREGWEVASNAVSGPPKSVSANQAPAVGSATAAQGSFALKLLLAFLGGLIMNVMPCVLPVIALKIFG